MFGSEGTPLGSTSLLTIFAVHPPCSVWGTRGIICFRFGLLATSPKFGPCSYEPPSLPIGWLGRWLLDRAHQPVGWTAPIPGTPLLWPNIAGAPTLNRVLGTSPGVRHTNSPWMGSRAVGVAFTELLVFRGREALWLAQGPDVEAEEGEGSARGVGWDEGA